MTKLTITYSDDYLNWRLGSGDGSHPTNPIRAKLAVDFLQAELDAETFEIIEPEFRTGDREKIEEVHGKEYVAEVLDYGKSNDWGGTDLVNGYTAGQMFAGTARLVEKIIAGETQVGFNPQGAKHHAQEDWSEGFCVFNDMAWAAKEFKKHGLKAVYIDWDVNAGDGVQNLLEDTDIPTFSIHGHGIYPVHSMTWMSGQEGNYEFSNPEQHWYNYCLQQGEGDEAFAWAIDEIAKKVAEYQPDVILLATGADGHEGEKWGLKYTYAGYEYAAKKVAEMANLYAEGRVLIGGAGGYQPHTHTPRIWANVVEDIVDNTLDRK
jgi:acetoin utilization deacetylase AcuC-like enzyme